VVQENSILKIKVFLTTDTKKMYKEKSNIICLIYSDETKICKAGLFPPGSGHILTLIVCKKNINHIFHNLLTTISDVLFLFL
jgi:hypothetical protein